MIRFFRHIRKKLMEQNKIKKYLLYAVGEILLVVIGILIALQVNNWNEQRKQEEEAIRVLSDFTNTTEQFVVADPAYHLMPNIQLDTVHYHILNNTVTPDLLDNSLMPDPRALIIDPMLTLTSTEWFYNENLNTILQNERLFPEQFKDILFNVRRINAAYQSMRSLADQMKAMLSENQRYLRDKEWMYLRDEESFRARIEFYHTDTKFQNQVRSFRELNELYMQQEEVFIKYLMFTWIEYQALVNQKNYKEIFEEIESAGYQRAEEIECSNELVSNEYGEFYAWFPIFNNTDEPVEVYHRNPITGAMYLFATIEPGGYAGNATNREFPYMQVGTNNSCERQYAVSWDKVVVIEP